MWWVVKTLFKLQMGFYFFCDRNMLLEGSCLIKLLLIMKIKKWEETAKIQFFQISHSIAYLHSQACPSSLARRSWWRPMWHEIMPQGPQVEKHSPHVKKSNQSGQVKLKIPFFIITYYFSEPESRHFNLWLVLWVTLSVSWSVGPLVFPMKKITSAKISAYMGEIFTLNEP